MPQPFKNAVLTEGGLALLNRAQAGEVKIKFTCIKTGNGTYGEEDKSDEKLQEMTELKSEKNSYPISDVSIFGNNAVKVTALITNQDPVRKTKLVEEGYYINEMGLFAKPEDDAEGDEEVLYSITVTAGENGDYMPPYNGYNPAQITQDYYATVSNSSEVTINSAGAALLAEDFDQRLGEKIGMPEEYDPEGTYEVGDTAVYDGEAYRCKEKIESGEPWSQAHWEKANLYDEVGTLQRESKKSHLQIYSKISHLDQGKNLAETFSGEISRYADAWEWIQDRIDKQFFDGLNVEDYLPLTVSSEAHEMQIAGINTYANTGGSETHGTYNTADLTPVPPHIDFISRDCLKATYQWNTTATNSGTGAGEPDDGTDVPWLTSNIKSKLDALHETLPENVKKHTVSKSMLLERRAKKEPVLTASTGWHWYPMGKLWLPTEYEVFGSVIWGTPGLSSGQSVQYPIFANSWRNRIKGAGPKGERCYWWLAVVSGMTATGACLVAASGHAHTWTATNSRRVPVCFRFAKAKS